MGSSVSIIFVSLIYIVQFMIQDQVFSAHQFHKNVPILLCHIKNPLRRLMLVVESTDQHFLVTRKPQLDSKARILTLIFFLINVFFWGLLFSYNLFFQCLVIFSSDIDSTMLSVTVMVVTFVVIVIADTFFCNAKFI